MTKASFAVEGRGPQAQARTRLPEGLFIGNGLAVLASRTSAGGRTKAATVRRATERTLPVSGSRLVLV